MITDEGGVRRTLDFSKPELTVGRVQGNDIVLSKRNVSKQHARLTLKGEQAVVVDLNSTNGTWVNGRKINSPQSLKHGDKIYIADFIITVEPSHDDSERASSAPRVSEPPPLPPKQSMPAQSSMPGRRSMGVRRSIPTDSKTPEPQDIRATSLPPRIERRATGEAPVPARTETQIPIADPLSSLLSRLAKRMDIENIDPAEMKTQERWSAARAAIAETFLAMQTDGSVNAEVDMRPIAHIALHEAVGLGALDDLLSDESVRAVVVNGPSHVFVDRGEGLEAVSLKFSSKGALHRVARRLAAGSGQTLEGQPVLHGRLSFGPRLTIMQPPLVMQGPVIELRIRSTKSLEQLAEAEWMSADAATYLAKALAECRNIVVAGPRGSGVTEMMSALARELPETENSVAIEAVPDLDIDRSRMIALTAADSGISLGEAIEHGTRLQAEHLVINDLAGADTMTALAAVLGCEPGHLLGVHCWSTKDAIEGLMLAAGCGGAERACVAQMIGSAIDLVIAMQRGPEGQRVSGILEIQGHEAGDVSYQSVPF
ncbi:MAG: Flp pilus assembly complex ATPase component TadA [Deltaproteobacteria bacterium]|nr:Flp pilus assembly complex ATPase component TadA [Deltaproteobacteria bacterium]MBW2213938.1 Flp pilus assembly complex ATPase component TadA [Deltaproteobacteria bacterium]MBW2378410.1 Flp pilus assembly complex ATPase component TadA [Deltaproteobacteria bacterium]MBW2549911.1 Flp pilus assembly complex ATPase component TadA [Deltaproteobacteria bacterium]